jgi:hypothetical protein
MAEAFLKDRVSVSSTEREFIRRHYSPHTSFATLTINLSFAI